MENMELNWVGGLLRSLKSQGPDPIAPFRSHSALGLAKEGSTLLLLGIIHADLKDRGPFTTQKGHSGGGASCTPFQAVDTATPVLRPEEVVAMVT